MRRIIRWQQRTPEFQERVCVDGLFTQRKLSNRANSFRCEEKVCEERKNEKK